METQARVNNSDSFEVDDEIMSKINVYSRKELKKDDIYAFPIILCDNNVDRDYERFSVKALEALSEMFIGKTGIFDHNPKGENQTARIFDAEVKTDKSRAASTGEAYTYLLAKAYMIKTDKTGDLISEIEAGIKKEVSISCKIDREICSVCGADMRVKPCSHIKGRKYGKKVCHTVLEEPSDAYEWSFVAIPAQPNAGVIKGFRNDNDSLNMTKNTGRSRKDLISDIKKKDDIISKLYDDLKHDVISMQYLCEPSVSSEYIEKNISTLDCEELLCLKRTLSEKTRGESLFLPQLWTKKDGRLNQSEKTAMTDNNEFKLNKKLQKRRKNYV